MRLKLRLVCVLTVLAGSFLFITFKLFTNLEDYPSDNHITTFDDPDSTHKPQETISHTSPWKVWSLWVQLQPTILVNSNNFYSSEMDSILSALSSYPITKFDVGLRGTQLKTTMFLKGDQQTVFKPKRFSRTETVDGPDNPYAGYDRHNGEIAAFHLDGILGFGLAPPVAGRKINLTQLIPVTENKLFETYVMKDKNVCFFGKCHYCNPSELACADGEIMEGSVTIWIPKSLQLRTWRHPYQRTYIPARKASWEMNNDYCESLMTTESKYYYLLPDIMDTTVFDYLIGNADRHHFETFADLGIHGRLLHIDSGKSFGNPSHDEKSILTPLKQCCRLRSSTWIRLLSLSKAPLSMLLDNSMQRDVLYPILSGGHLEAIDRRLLEIIHTIEHCISTHGEHKVLFDVWK